MSKQLLDLAVQEVGSRVGKDHFLRQPHNIEAVKRMITGDSDCVAPAKTWLYEIVCNKHSGMSSHLPACSVRLLVYSHSSFYSGSV